MTVDDGLAVIGKSGKKLSHVFRSGGRHHQFAEAKAEFYRFEAMP